MGGQRAPPFCFENPGVVTFIMYNLYLKRLLVGGGQGMGSGAFLCSVFLPTDCDATGNVDGEPRA